MAKLASTRTISPILHQQIVATPRDLQVRRRFEDPRRGVRRRMRRIRSTGIRAERDPGAESHRQPDRFPVPESVAVTDTTSVGDNGVCGHVV